MRILGNILKFAFAGILIVGHIIASIVGAIMCAVTSQN